jgi:hypothetical protein
MEVRVPSLRVVFGVIVGAAAGYAYYRVVGCSTGACPITANPWMSTGYGAVMGFLVAGSG